MSIFDVTRNKSIQYMDMVTTILSPEHLSVLPSGLLLNIGYRFLQATCYQRNQCYCEVIGFYKQHAINVISVTVLGPYYYYVIIRGYKHR